MVSEVEAYIRQRAPLYGVDPDYAVRVARGEGGLHNPFRHGEGPAPRSQDPRFGKLENSYGPFQLYVSGTGAGLGDRALAAGIDPTKKGDEAMHPAGYSTRPQGPVEAAGGGYGSDPVNPAMQPPQAGGRNGLASVMAGQAGGPPGAAPAPKKKGFLASLGEGLSAMGDAYGSGGGGGGPMRSVAPQAARLDAAAPVAPFDTQQADQQRQMLALAIQRLNSGRLF
jgi:hypothetical protein